MAPSLDESAPDFELPATGGHAVRLSELRGRHVVLYFYPRDATPGCTTESRDFRDLHDAFDKADAIIFGISRDSLASHEKFRQKESLPFALLSDEGDTVCRAWDVIKPKKMYGKSFEGIERSTFLIDRDGTLRREWRKVKVPGHAEAVLDAVREL